MPDKFSDLTNLTDLTDLTDLSTTPPPKKKWYHLIPPSLRGLLFLVSIAWFIEIIDHIPGIELDAYGVIPRSISGLIGIPLMPFLHGNFSHLISNTFPFLILGFIVQRAEKKHFFFVNLIIALLCGAGTWLIGRHSVHIGASGVVYGYFGYVMIRAFMERNFTWILTGLAIGFFYGSMIFGALPSYNQTISWEGHLCGMVAGIWIGRRKSIKIKALKNVNTLPEF